MHNPAIRNSVSYEDRSRNNYFYNRPKRTNQEMQRRMPNWQNGSGLNQNERHLSAKIMNDHPAFPFYNGLRKNQPIKPTLLLPPRANYYQNMSSDFDNRREPEPYKSVKNPSSRGRKHFPYSRRFNDGFEDYSRHHVHNFMENQNHRPMQKHWYREDVGRGMQRYNENEQNAYTRSKDFERHRYIEYPKCHKFRKFERTSPEDSYRTNKFLPQSYFASQIEATNHTEIHYGKQIVSAFYADNSRSGTHEGISPRSNYYQHENATSNKYLNYTRGNNKNNSNPNRTKKNDYCRNNPSIRYCQPEAEFHETMKINEGFQPIQGFQSYQMNESAHKMDNRQYSGDENRQVRFHNTQESCVNRDHVYWYRQKENATFNKYANWSNKNSSDPINDKWSKKVDEQIRRDNATDFFSDNQSILSKISVPNIMAKNMKPFNSNKDKKIISNEQIKSSKVLPEVYANVNKENTKNDVQKRKTKNENKMKKKTVISDSTYQKDLSCDAKPPCLSNNLCTSGTNQAEATNAGHNNELITTSEINKELLLSSLVECSQESEQTIRKKNRKTKSQSMFVRTNKKELNKECYEETTVTIMEEKKTYQKKSQ